MRVSTPYLPPLDQLLALGRPQIARSEPWLDYLAMGFTAEHVPELVRMAIDAELVESGGDEAQSYGGVHAWRALGQLRAEAAIDPLLPLLGIDDEWAMNEIPEVLGMIGPAAFEPTRVALARWSLAPEPWAATGAAGGLVEIAERFPEMRDAAVAALAKQLRWWARQDIDLNTMLVHHLVELKAVEAAPVIEEAFAADAVDTGWGQDDWEDVQVALGLLPERITPRPVYVPPTRLRPAPAIRIVPPAAADPKRRRKARKPRKPRHRRR
ncbi:MAG: PBS lyase [Longimicrobiaceae bacterium]